MRKILPLVILAIACFTQFITAQVNGTATAPVASTLQSPIYFFIESASDGSYSFSSYTGDFRGEVIISPDTKGFLIHNTLGTASTPDHALWAIVDVRGTKLLKNKATGLYMTGCHTADTITTGNGFLYTSLGQKQYLIRTLNATSYTITWKANLCNRINVGLQLNSLTAWYFIPSTDDLPKVLKLSLFDKITEAKNLQNITLTGTDFGQYTTENRESLNTDVQNAQAIYDAPESTASDISIGTTYIDEIMTTYKNAINSKPTSLLSTNPDMYRWYWIRSYATGAPYCFNNVISEGTRTLGQKYTFEPKADPATDIQLFRFVLSADKTKVLSIIDKKGNHIAANGAIDTISTVGNEFTLNPQSDGVAFWIDPTSVASLRATEGLNIDNWKYMVGSASSWVFDYATETARLTKPRTITVSSANTAQGLAVITGTTDASVSTLNDKVSVTAIPVLSYFFTKWTNQAGDSISASNPYIYTGIPDTTLVAHFENGYYRNMARYFTGSSPKVQAADRYLTSATVQIGDNTQAIISDVTANPSPIDSLVLPNTLVKNSVINLTQNQIIIPEYTSLFNLTCIGSSATIENLKWTQQNAFIDWNHDYDFLDVDEAGIRSSAASNNDTLTTGFTRTITLPIGLQVGTYRMRVVYHESSSPATDWSTSIWTNNYLRNGVAYDFEIKYGLPNKIQELNQNNIKAFITGNKLKVVNAENSRLELRDVTGRLISTANIKANEQELNAPLVHGIYFVTIKNQNNKGIVIKIVR